MAASLERQVDMPPIMLRNTTPLSLGILCADKKVHKVVKRNTVYPNKIKCKGKTITDNQKNMAITIFEGEHDETKFNKKLGTMILKGIEIASAGTVKADIFFNIDSNGELTIEAIDVKTKAKASIAIERPKNFSDEEIDKMRNELDMLK